jgi:hypothetical protein
MLDRRTAPDGLGKQPPARPVLRPGDANWRARWLAAVRRRMSVDPVHAARMRATRVQALAADPTLWAELRAAEAAFARGEGELFMPGQADAGAGR